MDDLYKEVLLEHYKTPVNHGKILHPDIKKEDSNPLCGDVVEIFLTLKDNKVKDAKFEGKGCVICIATTDLLLNEIKNKTLKEIMDLDREDILDLIQINLNHARIKCAMLPLTTIKKGIVDKEAKK